MGLTDKQKKVLMQPHVRVIDPATTPVSNGVIGIDGYRELYNGVVPDWVIYKEKWGDIALGDSLTANSGYSSWWDYLCANSWGLIKRVNNAGYGGDTIEDAHARYATEVGAYFPETVHIMLGTNNLGPDTVEVAIAKYQSLLDTAKSFGQKIIMYNIAPNNDHEAKAIEFNSALDELASLNGLPIYQIWTPFANPDYTWITGFSPDGWHPYTYNHTQIGFNAKDVLGIPSTPNNTVLYSGLPNQYNHYKDALFQAVTPFSDANREIYVTPGEVGNVFHGEYTNLSTSFSQISATGIYSAQPIPIGGYGRFSVKIKVYDCTDNFYLEVRPANGLRTGKDVSAIGRGVKPECEGIIVTEIECNATTNEYTGLYLYAKSFNASPASGKIELSQAQVHKIVRP